MPVGGVAESRSRRANRRAVGAERARDRPRLRHLYLRLDRRTQGGDDRASQRAEHRPGHQRAVWGGRRRSNLCAVVTELRSFRLRHFRRVGGRRDDRRATSDERAGAGRLGGHRPPGESHDLELGARPVADVGGSSRKPAERSFDPARVVERGLDPRGAAGPSTRRAAGIAAAQPRRRDRSFDLVDLLPDPHREQGLEEHSVRPASAQPANARAERRDGAMPDMGAGANLYRRHRARARVLARRSKDPSAVRLPSAKWRTPLSNRGFGTLSAGWQHRVSGSGRRSGQGAGLSDRIGGDRGNAGTTSQGEVRGGDGGGRTCGAETPRRLRGRPGCRDRGLGQPSAPTSAGIHGASGLAGTRCAAAHAKWQGEPQGTAFGRAAAERATRTDTAAARCTRAHHGFDCAGTGAAVGRSPQEPAQSGRHLDGSGAHRRTTAEGAQLPTVFSGVPARPLRRSACRALSREQRHRNQSRSTRGRITATQL